MSTLAFNAPRQAARSRPRALEFRLTFLVLLATAVFPAFSKYSPADQATASSPTAQIVWSITYVVAFFGLIPLWNIVRPLVGKSLVLCSFVLLMLASFMWSVEPGVTLANAVELIGTTIVAFYIVARFTLREMLELVGFTLFAIALASLVFVFAAPGHGRMNWGSGAWSGIYQDKNNLGAAMSLAIISLAALAAEARGRARWFAAAGAGFCAVMLAGSNSATAFADCGAAMLVLFVALAWRSPRFGAAARVLTVLGALVLVFVVTLFGLTPQTIIEALGRDVNLTGRTDFWPYIQTAIGDRPVLGFGYNAFFRSPVGADYMSTYVVEAGGWTPYHAHNSFLQIALDCGFVGLALLIVLVASALSRGARFVARSAHGFSAWPLAITTYLLLGSFTETYLGNYNTFEWIFFVAALLYPLRAHEPARDAQKNSSTKLHDSRAIATAEAS